MQAKVTFAPPTFASKGPQASDKTRENPCQMHVRRPSLLHRSRLILSIPSASASASASAPGTHLPLPFFTLYFVYFA